MYERELTLFAMQNEYVGRLVKDLDDDELDRQPAAGMNTPRWILGHLCIGNDYTMLLLGGEKLSPEAWWKSFDYGTQPGDPAAPPVTKADFLAMLHRGAARIKEMIGGGVDAKALAAPNEFEALRKLLPTRGDFVAHLLTTHVAGHLGQLSAWRRAVGKPPVM